MNTQENTDNGALSESLMDALESIQESQQDLLRLNRQASPLQKLQDPDRITDYPRGPSPNVSTLSLNSRRSSLSAMSQSSLTSDSSFDASKKPGKKILKNPQRAQRRSKNRVRWKLPNSDSDTLSIDSCDSSSTVNSSVYNRARNGVLAAKQNWRDFERSPPKGSTGITPMKPSTHQMRGSLSTGALHIHQYSPPSKLSTIPQDAVIGDLGTNPHRTLTVSKSTPSPLTYNTSSNNSLSQGALLHSTPIRHTQSASDIGLHRRMQLSPGHSPNTSSDIDFPILRIDNSNLTDLEESTLEDRKQMHIFQFPQSRQQSQHSTGRPTFQSPDSSRSKQTAPPTAAALLDDDDANDYDHLSPLHASKTEKQEKPVKNEYDIYSDEDIDEALEAIAKELPGSSSGGSHAKEELRPSVPPHAKEELRPSVPPHAKEELRPSVPPHAKEELRPSVPPHAKEELPPSVPLKKHHHLRKAAIGPETTGNVNQTDPTKPAPAPAPIVLFRPSTRQTSRGSQGNDTRTCTSRSPQVPPPVPPKMRKRSQSNNMIPPSSQPPKEAYPPEQRHENHVQEDKTPLRFATDGQNTTRKLSPAQSHTSTDEDPMSSVSNTTLVEQEDATLKSSKFNATGSVVGPAVVYPATSQHTTDTKQSWRAPGLTDRIAEGAENPEPPVDKRLRSSSNQFQTARATTSNFSLSQTLYNQSSSQGMQYFQDSTIYSGSYSQPDTNFSDFMVTTRFGQPVRGGRTSKAPEKKLTVPTSPRYKISLETAFTEGNLMKGLSYSPPNHTTSASQSNQRIATKHNEPTHRVHRPIPRSNSVGQYSQPAGSLHTSLSSEEQHVRQRFYSGGKLPMEKPVVHVKSQSVSQLLRELDINDKKPKGLLC